MGKTLNIIKSWIGRNKNLLLTIFTILSLPIITNFIIILKAPSFIPIAKENDWIGFYGSIAGGVFTLIALKATINHERDLRKKEERMQVYPYLSYSVFDFININSTSNSEAEDIERSYEMIPTEKCYMSKNAPYYKDGIINKYLYVAVVAKNIGMGIALNPGVTSMLYLYTDAKEEIDIKYPIKRFFPIELQKEACFILRLVLPENKILNSVHVGLFFYDILGNYYEQDITIKIINSLKASVYSEKLALDSKFEESYTDALVISQLAPRLAKRSSNMFELYSKR